MQKLWFATRKRAWLSLAVVPATPGFSAAPLAQALAQAGESHVERVHLLDAEGADMCAASRMVEEMRSQVGHGHCVIVAVDSLLQNAAGIPLLLAADACLLGVQLGQSRFSHVERTLERVDASRFVGVVTFPLPGKASDPL